MNLFKFAMEQLVNSKQIALEILGITSKNPLMTEISKAYKQKIISCHPDLHKDIDPNEIKLINSAYAFLANLYLQKIDPKPKTVEDTIIDKEFSNYLEDNKITFGKNCIAIIKLRKFTIFVQKPIVAEIIEEKPFGNYSEYYVTIKFAQNVNLIFDNKLNNDIFKNMPGRNLFISRNIHENSISASMPRKILHNLITYLNGIY